MARWIDYEPYANRSVAEFRAKREMCGISIYEVADVLGVTANTVKRWENPNYFPPSPEAWRYIDREYEKHCDAVEAKLTEVMPTPMGQPIVVTWTRNGMNGAHDREVNVRNAISQAVAESLLTLGREVTFRWENPEAEEAQRAATSDFYRRSDPEVFN